MTRRDYILLARALQFDLQQAKEKKLRLDTAEYAIEYAAEGIAVALAGDNPRFDREHFLAVVRGEKDINSRPARQREPMTVCEEHIQVAEPNCPTCRKEWAEQNNGAKLR